MRDSVCANVSEWLNARANDKRGQPKKKKKKKKKRESEEMKKKEMKNL